MHTALSTGSLTASLRARPETRLAQVRKKALTRSPMLLRRPVRAVQAAGLMPISQFCIYTGYIVAAGARTGHICGTLYLDAADVVEADGHSALSQDTSMFKKLGGTAAIEGVVDEFYSRVFVDDEVKGFFEGIDKKRLKSHQVFSQLYPDV